MAKGSSAHNLLVTALESANIAWSDITPLYLAPADAASAFARGSIDAWSIWDPFYAIAELKQNARALPIDPKKTAQNSFFLANRDFLSLHADLIAAINEEIASATAWAGANRDEAAALFSEASGSRDRRAEAICRSRRIHFRGDRRQSHCRATGRRPPLRTAGTDPRARQGAGHCLEWKVKLLNSSHGQITLGRASVRKKLARRSPSIQRQRGQRK